MVRARITQTFDPRSRAESARPVRGFGIILSGALFLSGGCALAPRAQIDECQQQSRTLRSENARLKDQLLVVQAQNRDYADRALDDSHRLATQDAAIERLESSVQAYQDERARLESAFNQLASSLGQPRAQADDRPSRSARPATPTPKRTPRSESTSTSAREVEDKDRVQ
jgi:chromosome segregation ATPase